jgi:hypothetical protein
MVGPTVASKPFPKSYHGVPSGLNVIALLHVSLKSCWNWATVV